MIVDVLKGFLIGICASAPIGPIAIFVIQKSLSKGRNAGFLAGMGSALVDTIYSIIAIFALAFVESFLDRSENWVMLGGGALVVIIGISMMMSNPFRKLKAEESTDSMSTKDFLKAVAMGFSNPGAILVIFTLFAFFGIDTIDHRNWGVAPIILAVSCGAALYWFGFASLAAHFRNKLRMENIVWVNRITGIIVVIIGLALFADGLFSLIFPSFPKI